MTANPLHARTKWLRSKVSPPCNYKLVLNEDTPRKVSPSVYTQEMLKSTEERLANINEVHPPRILELLDMSKTTHHKLSLVDMDQPLFQPYPSELVFQNFTPGQTYKLPLLLLNNDKVSRQVKLEMQDSEQFHVVGPEEACTKVAPGMSATFAVSFTPQENKDYHHRLVFVTERERFEVPIHAIGPRAILDFRDELHLPVCLVKASTESTTLVRNIGNCKAMFQLHTQRPFSITPSCGALDVGEGMQVTVEFNPMTAGDYSQDLLLHYHTGEDVYIRLYGTCEELNIHLEPDSVLLKKTYISLANVNTVCLTNRGDIPLQYYWTTWPSLQEEALSLLRESSVLQQKEENEREQLLFQCESDPTAIHRLPLLSKALQERRSQAVKGYRLELPHSCITVEPAPGSLARGRKETEKQKEREGEIWPKMTARFIVVFKPEEAKLYQQTIYCDVTGRESRLPLTIKGEGMGPELQLSYNLMNMKNKVFIGAKSCYEVLGSNRGLIDAPFRLSSPDTPFGRCFSFSPEEGVIPSGASQIVGVTFHSRILGTFSEDLLLTVTGQPQPLTLTFRGCVIGPTFHFNVSEFDFGDVAFGFPLTLICTLFNTSLVPMTFALRVPGDGLGSPSVTCAKQVSSVSMNNWQGSAARDLHARPVEFTVSPVAGSVAEMSDVTIKVTLCSNTVRTYRLALVVDVEGVGEEITTLPIIARCVVPDIVVETPVLDFQRCFLNHSYEQQVQLINTSTLPACFVVLDQEYEESPSLIFGSSVPRGVILPRSSEAFPVFLQAKAVGRLHHTLRIAVFGSAKPPLEVVLSCIGQGPVVHVQSPQLDFGTIPVLTDITRALHLSNQSPIPAHFTARMSHGRSFWRVEPSEGEVPPESQLELRVVAHLKDTLHFQERLEVSIQDSQTHTVALSATGTGTTIVSDRPFAPSLDLGTYFSPGSCQYHFKLTNHGQRIHRMHWRTEGFLPFTKTRKGENPSGRTFLPPISAPGKTDLVGRGSMLSSSREKPVFSLSPSHVELFPGCSVDMVLTGSSDFPKVVQEHLVCHGIVGRNDGGNKHIMSVHITCRFVAPVLTISSKQLNFYIEKVPGKSLVPLYEKLILENVSSLPLSLELSLIEPFSLCDAPGALSSATTKSMVLGDGRQVKLWVCFNPSYCRDRVSQVVDEFLEVHFQGHPQQDMVKLHAEVHFPNLHFSSNTVDFGCVLNCTETHREISITNCSPLPVSYHWAFLDDQKHCTIRETQMLEAEEEQKNTVKETKEGWSFALTASPAYSVALSPRPGADDKSSTQSPPCVEEVFDILPIYGHLQPGNQQLVILSFYGHKNVSREVVAQCHVEEGPTYEIKLRGEASVISYSLDSTHIDFGLQLFDHKGEAEVTLRNTGKLGFKFSILQEDDEGADEETGVQKMALDMDKQQPDARQQKDNEQNDKGQEVIPGRPMVIPSMGYVAGGAEQSLRMLYIPGIPGVFEKRLQLRVAYLPPQDITLTGVGVFPRIRLNLPQNLSDECYCDVVKQARTAVETDRVSKELMNGITTGGGATAETNCTLTYEELLHMEIERTLVKQNALAVTGSLLELRDSQGSSRKWHRLSKFLLPEYVLDFGYVIPGKVLSHTINVTNTGSVAVSFHANRKSLAGTGFSAEFERVKNLPCGETQTFTVKFDPQGANLKMGGISVVMPIQVTGGPMVQVRLCGVVTVPAISVSTNTLQFDTVQCGMCQVTGGPMVQVRLCGVVTVPAISVSTNTLQFDTVQCGMCQVKTIQLFNHESVPCYWSIAEEVKSFKKVDKFLPVYQRKKVMQDWRPPPVVFEIIPRSGTLSPGEQVNVQIKFSPAEGHAYSRQLVVRAAESTQQVFITAQGKGEEPQLEFCPSALELGPCLPVSTEVEAEVTVKNPCSFPIEFYSLEFDTQYLEEEKILRLMQGYDENNILLLPPRAPGESLPTELLDYYKDYCSQLKAELKAGSDEKEAGTGDTHEEEERSRQNNANPPDSLAFAHSLVLEITKGGSSGRLGQLEMTPVSRAIARHMCVDLSPEGLAARNRRGIAVIVYGAPQTDKSSTAAALARHYGGACLSVDAVVTDVLINGASPVSLTARRLYDCAAAEYADKKAEEAAQSFEKNKEPGPAPHLESSDPATNSAAASHDTVEVLAKLREDSCSKNDSKAPQETKNKDFALCLGGDVTTFRNLLPEQLLVEILAERFQLSDCHRGIVIGSLESVYTQSAASTLQVVLKALNNRKHIYVVNLSDSYAALKARETAQREAQEALQKEKADREEQWLQELDGDEYDALPEEVKEHIALRHREKLRLHKLRELGRIVKVHKEQRNQEEMKRLREEELKKKSKKLAKKDNKEASKKKSLVEGKQSSDALNGRRMSTCNKSKESLVDVNINEGANMLHQNKEADHSHIRTEEAKVLQAESPQPEDKLEGEISSVDELQSQFSEYERIQEQVEHILHHWDRVQGLLLVPLPSEECPPVSEDAATEKQTPVGKRSKKASTKTLSPLPSQMAAPPEADKAGDKVYPQDIPHIVLNVTGKDYPSATELLSSSVLPPLDEVLEDLGFGPGGPPILPPTTFSMVPFPKTRKQSNSQLTCDCFTFLVPSELGERREEKKDSEEDLQTSVVKVMVEAAATPSKSGGKGSTKESAVTKDKDKKDGDSQRSRRRTSAKTKSKDSDRSRSPQVHVSSMSDCIEQDQHQHQRNLELKRKQSLTRFRWVVPPNSEVVLKIWFYSDSPGKFEQTFNFELLGTKRHYQLPCRGLCTYPSICKDYMTLFALSKKVPQMTEGTQKTYVITPGYFEFGPLLCGKTRDRYKENKYPENTERLVIHNNSGLEAEVQFSFQHDTQATTYLLYPPTMTLKPDQKQELTVWAYPTKLGQMKDSVVCYIKDNPELVIINLSCWGVRPMLELESKHLHFDRVLLHRQDSRSVMLHNKTALPVSWRLQGAEDLGDEFSVPQDEGIISPNSSIPLSLHFRARKPLHIKKILRLEVSDVAKILGIVHTENIQVTAEAYDIALDISPDGCLDFGTIKVFEEAKLSLRMKNQGKYEIAYKFTFQQTNPTQPNLDSIFTVSPQSGTLTPHEKATTVQILCRPKTEVLIREQPVLPCQVIEPSIGSGGETIAILAIKVSVKSVFSRYKITPACDINFGPRIYGSKKSKSFTIENNGVFETRFTICRMIMDPAPPGRPGGPGKKMPQESHSGRPTAASFKVRRESFQKDMSITQNRLTMGVFSVSPCTGSLQPGSQQVVTVDCVAEQLGNWNQGLLIDISDRDPSDQPDGIPYRLLAEVCKPGIALDMASIFEEHHLCYNSGQLSSEQFCHAESIYVQDENKFIFNKVLVGRSAKARFKLTNNTKVPCVLSLAIKYVASKTSRNVEAFDLSATTLSIPSQSHSFAVVTFTPQMMQLYSAVFEATMEGTSRMTPTFKSKVLEFDLTGEGTLPSVCVVRPPLRNSGGSPLLQFKRVLVGRKHSLPLVLLNDGNVPAQVQIDMLDKHGVFTLKAARGNTCSTIDSTQLEGTTEHRLVHRAILSMNVNEQVEFEVNFCSYEPLSIKAKMSLQVGDNQYSKTIIRVSGEAYQEIVSLDNIGRSLQEMDQEDDEGGNYEVLNFGDCHVDCPYQESFTMTNHSSSQVVRFEWPPAGPHVFFSPQVGHLHAGCSKEVTVTFCSSQPVTLSSMPMRCKVCQVEFQQPVEEVADWDDRQRTVQWLSSSKEASGEPQQPVKNKVIKTDPEPCCSVVEGSLWELELCISAVCDYVKFSCNTDIIHFKDTLLYQTRIHQLQIVNNGAVKLEFSFQVLMEPSNNIVNYDQGDSRSAGMLIGACPASVMPLLMGNPERPPVSIEPSVGAIEPGAKQNFSIRFSPLEVANFQGRLFCRLPLSVSFTPCRKGYVSFRLVLRVKRKSEPLALTVKANCFTMSTSVQVEKPDGGLREISPNHQDTLDFGMVEISEQSTFNFLVSNLAKFSLEVNFDLTGPSELLQHLDIKPQNATIDVGKKLHSSLFFCARSICNLQDIRLSIKITHGPTFTFAIKGRAIAPSLEFSFTKYNFGKCFLYSPGMVPTSQTLVIRNKGEKDISVQCLFNNTSYLEIDFQPDILSPGAVMEVPINFCPREAGRYHEKFTFILNSCVTKLVDILGLGIEMKLEVEDPKQRKVKLGSLMLGQKVKKQVVLVNRSPLDLSFTLVLNTNTPLDSRDLSFSPAGDLNLKASGGSCNVEIQFTPRQHIPPFTAELQAEFAGLLHPLLTIQGCCQRVEVQLDQAHLAFGAVVQRCKARKKIVMMNTGDIGARFQWKTVNFPPELSIAPAKGYICPGMEVPFEVTFAPKELINDTRYENLSCCVEGSSSPVTLTVTGSCIVASTSKEVVNFVCPVRDSHIQTLHVFNPTSQHCSIRPVIEGEQWSAAPSVILEPLQNKTYEITYQPLTMTADGKKHTGSVFFSFPDGTGMLYSLQGTAEPPKAEHVIVHELPAKTHHTQLLPVRNWLSKQQRFRVLMEILKPDRPDPTVSLKGLEYIDVPALAKRDYKMSFFTYREGQYNTKVTFCNVVSGEYLFYLVTFKATSPGVLSTIELVTAVRQAASATVQVENPLTTATCLTTECKCPDISAPPQHTVPGQSKSSLTIEYQPLRTGETTARLTLSSNDLGFFHYDLLLRALPPPPEKTVYFNTSLGNSHSVLVKFINYSRIKTEYSCKTDCPHFIVDKSVGASPGFQAGSEASVEVCFEPHQLGEVRGQLRLSSGIGGEYIFPLHGICLPPKAQGPFSIRAGRNITLPFKNVFLQTTAFSFQVDNPCFTVKGVDTILSKKTQNILISFEAPPGGSPGPWFGKLTISSQCSEGRSTPCSWVYYLKGQSPESS
ncbi:hydrocephalus-inducing protein homolog [Micropterus dolomieu]|uniref:hydrocephalus-inducing protein homolog n=1 Tax=Micropterus dolomieu TaxID=147949 RepID=UPI001E8D38CC|nr:hydrocephalus-inducing protein homolog [Micropterus dolomieu]